jgi:hypothetical protein
LGTKKDYYHGIDKIDAATFFFELFFEALQVHFVPFGGVPQSKDN